MSCEVDLEWGEDELPIAWSGRIDHRHERKSGPLAVGESCGEVACSIFFGDLDLEQVGLNLGFGVGDLLYSG